MYVFSLSRGASFDLGRYPRGESRERTFTRPGLVKVYCHLHSQMSATIVVQRTTGVSVSGQYNTLGSQIQQSNSSTSSAITYQYTLASGVTLSAGTNRTLAAQFGGTGTAHPTTGDTWTVTYTSGGTQYTQTGTF